VPHCKSPFAAVAYTAPLADAFHAGAALPLPYNKAPLVPAPVLTNFVAGLA